MNIAITGASGLIGSALARHLETEKHTVLRLRRGPKDGPGADWDPAAGWVRDGVFDGVDAVVHLAGEDIGAGRWSASRRQELRASRIASTRLLIDHFAARQQRPATFVCASAIGFYGDRGDEPLTEEAPPGEGFLAGLVYDWEAEAARAADLGIRTVMLRFGLVLAKDGGVLARMLPPFKFGVGGRLGHGRQWMSWVSLEDAVRAIDHLLSSALSGPVNVTSPHPVTNREFTRALARTVRRPAVFPVPAFALRILFGAQRAQELFLFSQRVLPDRLLASGFAFTDPELEPALRRILRPGKEATRVAPPV